MTPATRDITIYRGGRFSETYTLKQRVSGDPVDLTGASPFKMQVRKDSEQPVILTITVADTDLVNGVLTVTATKEATANLPLGKFKYGLQDAAGNQYLKGTATIEAKIPE